MKNLTVNLKGRTLFIGDQSIKLKELINATTEGNVLRLEYRPQQYKIGAIEIIDMDKTRISEFVEEENISYSCPKNDQGMYVPSISISSRNQAEIL